MSLGSIRDTAFSKLSATQIAPKPVAIAAGLFPVANVFAILFVAALTRVTRGREKNAPVAVQTEP